MKRILSLIMAASILLQMIIPVGSKVTYAAPGDNLTWVGDGRLDEGLDDKKSNPNNAEAMVSWTADSRENAYILEYPVNNNGNPEIVRFTFEKDSDTQAEATIKVLELDDTPKAKKYRVYDFSGTTPGGWLEWEDGTEKTLENIDIRPGTKYPGKRVQIGDMEIRFKYEGGKVYFQSNKIEHGYITPFTLKHGGALGETTDVLTGLDGYEVSPVHIEVDSNDKITNKGTIVVPDDQQEPGSKPGIRVDFKQLKRWTGQTFDELTSNDGEKIITTLKIKGLTVGVDATLSFRLGFKEADGRGSEIVGPGVEDKFVSYDGGTYSIYLAQDDKGFNDAPHENIVKWEELDKSMILTTVELNLIEEGVQSLGTFSPKLENGGGHTYLGYGIGRSNMAEAFIEVQPYNGAMNTKYTYTVWSAPNIADGIGKWTKLIDHVHSTGGLDKENTFKISVPFESNSDDLYYKITVSDGQSTIDSQILHYKPKNDSIVPPTPIIQSVDNIYVVPPKKLGDGPETIGFDLTWSAPKNPSNNPILKTMLENGSIYYELFLHEDLESTDDKGTMIKVFKVSLDPNDQDKVIVEPYAGTAGTAGNNTLPEEKRYNPSKDTFTMENIVLKNPWKEGENEDGKWEQIKVNVDEYEEKNKYPDKDFQEIEATQDMLAKDVPGIYYVTMRAFYEDGVKKMGGSSISNPKSITISPLEEIIPVPTKLESKSILDETGEGIISQSFSWGNVNIDRYVKQMLEPLNLRVDGRGVYEVYLYQKRNLEESKILDAKFKEELDSTSSSSKLDSVDINDLRAGNAIRLDYKDLGNTGMSTITLEGLDKNQVYYMAVRVRLDIVDKGNQSFEEKRYSVLSKEHSFTSAVEPNEPGPGERVPPVPEKLQLIDQPNNTTAKIGWEAPDYTKQEGEELYYEMLRLDSRILAKEEDSRLLTITKLLEDDEEEEMAAWRTKGLLVEKYTKPDLWTPAIPEQESAKLQLEDPGLSPNKIYYYYVRTVLELEGEEIYSSWIGIPVTTDPIQKPIQLKVEDKEDYSHDPKKEIVVSFLAPIPQGADIPSDYDFDIAVQGELDDDYRLDYSTTRVTSTMDEKDIPTGYSHYVYKIRNLKPGKRYDIKVRVIDKVVDMVNGEYPKSLYSDRVTTRTHFDQDEQDKDDKFDEYLKYFEDKVEALRRKPYWTLEDRESLLSIKYRSNYIMPEISSSNAYQLEVREGVSEFNYYMPASVIASANLGQTSFEIKQGNVTYSVRPSTITTELEELKVALQDISEKYIRDYYVVFNFSQRPNRAGTDFLTPEISVDIELARLREEDLFIEDDIMVDLNERINSEKVRFIDDLERALDRGRILDEDLEILMNKSLESIQRNHQRDVRNIISRNTHRTVSIDKWNKSMLIMAIIDGNAVAEGYLLGNPDTALTTFNVGGGYGIEITRSGTYAFKGQKINMPVVPGAPGAGDLVAKYQLTDFFGIDGNIDPSRPVSKRNVLGAMARILGAPRGADYIQYLKQMNIKGINNIGMDSPIKKSEGIYLLMQVYEKTHKKPISTVYIKNRNAVSNIRQFNQLHQPYVLVAVDSKIISQGVGIRPNDAMPTKDVLQILTNIMATVR